MKRKRLLVAGSVGLCILCVLAGSYFFRKYHSPEAYIERGHGLQTHGRFRDAVSDFHEAARLQPNDAVAHFLYGNALMSVNHTYEHYPTSNTTTELLFPPPKLELYEAIAEFRRAVQLNRQEANYHSALAGALDNSGDTRGAMAEYRQILKILPHQPLLAVGPHIYRDNAQSLYSAYYELASHLEAQGDLPGAMQNYQAALRWQPQENGAHFGLASALLKNGQKDEARAQWKQVAASGGYWAEDARKMLAKYPGHS